MSTFKSRLKWRLRPLCNVFLDSWNGVDACNEAVQLRVRLEHARLEALDRVEKVGHPEVGYREPARHEEARRGLLQLAVVDRQAFVKRLEAGRSQSVLKEPCATPGPEVAAQHRPGARHCLRLKVSDISLDFDSPLKFFTPIERPGSVIFQSTVSVTRFFSATNPAAREKVVKLPRFIYPT